MFYPEPFSRPRFPFLHSFTHSVLDKLQMYAVQSSVPVGGSLWGGGGPLALIPGPEAGGREGAGLQEQSFKCLSHLGN